MGEFLYEAKAKKDLIYTSSGWVIESELYKIYHMYN